MRHPKFVTLIAVLFCAHFAGNANAAVIAYGTSPGQQFAGLDVSARATFTTSANQVQIVLENLESDPTSAQQMLSGIKFTLSTGQTSGTLASSSGVERSLNGPDGSSTFTDGSAVSTAWALTTSGSALNLSVLGTPESPQHTIIGPPSVSNSLYDNANSSLLGNHNPFLGLSATFTLTVPGVTSASTISAATFEFNTDAGSNAPGSNVTVNILPEPAALSLVGLMCAAMMRRR